MEIADLLTPRTVIPQLRVTGKKQALQEIARRAAAITGCGERQIYEVLTERERLGSTDQPHVMCDSTGNFRAEHEIVRRRLEPVTHHRTARGPIKGRIDLDGIERPGVKRQPLSHRGGVVVDNVVDARSPALHGGNGGIRRIVDVDE